MSRRIDYAKNPKTGKIERQFRQYRMPQVKAAPVEKLSDDRGVEYTRLNNGQLFRSVPKQTRDEQRAMQKSRKAMFGGGK